MAIKHYKPTTPGRRGMTVLDYSELSKVAPSYYIYGNNEVEKYYDVAPNSYLKEFAGVSFLTREFGDRTDSNGASLYLKNLNQYNKLLYKVLYNFNGLEKNNEIFFI